ncbi:MAG: cellulase family glycosylhydrolase [Sandaracinus sp.]|nr:cellulase family glycosylhydrolase [Sandaracinus sp.]MCB9611218.1 cellulase family glycosylhydrolase [Sandaracinus sp.]
MRRELVLVVFLGLLACGDDDAPPPDGGGPADAGTDAPEAADAGNVMPTCDRVAGEFAPLSTRCQHFVDPEGRVVLLRGVNARIDGVFDVDLGPERVPLEPIPSFDASDAAAMRALGFNVLRLPMQWSGVEPTDATAEEPPRAPEYDEAYLDRIAAVLDVCRDAGLYVLVDFHQDAYSKWIGEDGAPLWAIRPPPDEILEGPLDDLEARRTSGQVLRAFETFFGDSAEGAALRTRYAQMAAHVAARFAEHPAVVGYDLYNEPIGSDDEVLRLNAEVAAAIRAVSRQLVFFEPPVLQRNLSEASGRPDAPFPVEGAVYAPHIYTLAFFATDEQRETFTLATLRRGHASAASEAHAWGTPVFVGEWGYAPEGIRAEEYFQMQHDLQDQFGESSAVWLWKEDSQGSWGFYDFVDEAWVPRAGMSARFDRAYPERIAGWPRAWTSSADRLELHYDGDASVDAPTVLRLPEGTWSFSCDGASVEGTRNPQGRWELSCGGAGIHTVVATR